MHRDPSDQHRARHAVALEVGHDLGRLEARVRLGARADRDARLGVTLDLELHRPVRAHHRHLGGGDVVPAVGALLHAGEVLAVRLGQLVEHRERSADVAVRGDQATIGHGSPTGSRSARAR